MTGEKVLKALNDQMAAEIASEYIYLAMAAWFESKALPGFAHWMKLQAAEEHGHAMRFFEYIAVRDGRVEVTGVEKPPEAWESPLAAFEAALKHEKYVSGRIDALVGLARAEKDYATEEFLGWFVKEQVEEESSARTVVDQLKMLAGASGGAMLMLDRQMGKRGA